MRQPRRSRSGVAWSAGSTSGVASSSAMCSTKIPFSSTYRCRYRRGVTGDSTTNAARTKFGTSPSACSRMPSSTLRSKSARQETLLLMSPIWTGFTKSAVTSGATHLVQAGRPGHGAYRPPRFLLGRNGALTAPSMLLTSMSSQSILSSCLGRAASATTPPKQHYCNASSLVSPP